VPAPVFQEVPVIITGINVAETTFQHAEVHEPERPFWICGVDGLDWPCPARRQAMLESWEPTTLAIVMAGYFVQACAELSSGDVGEIHRRFLGWVRDAERSTSVDDRPTATG
jgi:hypothetical protein